MNDQRGGAKKCNSTLPLSFTPQMGDEEASSATHSLCGQRNKKACKKRRVDVANNVLVVSPLS